MPTIERNGRRKRELKNLVKRGGVWYFKKKTGKRVTCISLDTDDEEFARKRRDVLAVKVAGEKWEAIDGLKAKRNIATIGEVIERYLAATDLQLAKDTMQDYCWALRHLIRRTRQVEAVDNFLVSMLDAGMVRTWQQQCLAAAGNDKLKLDTAAVTANSIVGQARSLFSKRALARKIYDGMNIPDLQEFLTAPLLTTLRRDNYKKPPEAMIMNIWQAARLARNGSTPHPQPLSAAAAERVAPEGPPWKRPLLWLAFWIISQTGFRKGEACSLRYAWFDGEVVKVTFESDFISKSKRERSVPIAAGVEAECRRIAAENGWPTGPGDYVLPNFPGPRGLTRLTAMEDLFREFGEWMTANGWTRRQKAHELRKIFASDLTQAADPYETQLALGHGDIKTTMRYAARRQVMAVDQSLRYARIEDGGLRIAAA